MDVLIYTLVKRPYVFLFLAAFLFLSIRHLGLVKTLIWLVVGYFVALLSEYSSINNGFPYGEYHYIYENLQGELLFAGVPVWDSISYSFMTYASFAVAEYAMPKAKLWKLCVGGAVLTTLLDIITDPVAKLGKQWFLGEIYYYAHDGWYFHVPLTNFAGWFLVAAVIIGVNLLIFRKIDSQCHREESALGGRRGDPVNLPEKTRLPRRGIYPEQAIASRRTPRNDKVGILHFLFYVSICLFNTVIAFAIGAYILGIVNLVITSIVTSGIVLIRR